MRKLNAKCVSTSVRKQMCAHLFKEIFPIPPVSPPSPWKHFETDTQDLAGIEWAPNGCVLAAWDTCLEVRSDSEALPVVSAFACISFRAPDAGAFAPSPLNVALQSRSSA